MSDQKCYEFTERKEETIIEGKSVCPDYISIKIEKKRLWSLAFGILKTLQNNQYLNKEVRQEEYFNLYLFGKLEKDKGQGAFKEPGCDDCLNGKEMETENKRIKEE